MCKRKCPCVKRDADGETQGIQANDGLVCTG